MAEWVKLTPQQRRLARENYQITRTLPPEKKAEAWDRTSSFRKNRKSWPQPRRCRAGPGP
jgi:hypothetical protein